MNKEVSVILCTHNPRREYLQRTLDSLAAQTFPLAQWEFLFIDNASKEQLSEHWDLSWHPNGRHVREDQLGLTAARLHGIEEANGQLLIFVDDDNVLDSNFVEHALRIFKEISFVGVFGAGTLVPEFEIPPPRELVSRLSLLALRKVTGAMWSNNTNDFDCTPWGAGLCVNRQVALEFRQLINRLKVSTLVGRRGNQLFSGEDDLFSWASVTTGQGFGIFPELRITHLISAGRLNQGYFRRLIHDSVFSNAIINYLLTGEQQRRIHLVQYLRPLIHGIKNGQFSMRCQWAALRGQDKAARFIAENDIQPLEDVLKKIPKIANDFDKT